MWMRKDNDVKEKQREGTSSLEKIVDFFVVVKMSVCVWVHIYDICDWGTEAKIANAKAHMSYSAFHHV